MIKMNRKRNYLYRIVWSTGATGVWEEFCFAFPDEFLQRMRKDDWVRTIEFKNAPDHSQVTKFYRKYGKGR
jgi:hypothetical protein